MSSRPSGEAARAGIVRRTGPFLLTAPGARLKPRAGATAASAQCRKCRVPVSTMARPRSSAAAITSASRIEPPGWITAVAPASAAAIRPSANGKKASEATTQPLVSGSAKLGHLGGVDGLARGDAGGIDPAHLAGADAHRGAVLGIDDGVRLDVLADAEGELQILELRRGRRPLGHHLQIHGVDHRIVARLHQEAAGHRLGGEAGRARVGQAAGDQEAEVLLGGEHRDGVVVRLRRDDHLGEDLGNGAGGRGIEALVDGDDAAIGRDRDRTSAPCGRPPARTAPRRRRTDWRA